MLVHVKMVHVYCSWPLPQSMRVHVSAEHGTHVADEPKCV